MNKSIRHHHQTTPLTDNSSETDQQNVKRCNYEGNTG